MSWLCLGPQTQQQRPPTVVLRLSILASIFRPCSACRRHTRKQFGTSPCQVLLTYVCMRVNICICIFTYIYTCMCSIQGFIYTYIHIHTDQYMPTCIYIIPLLTSAKTCAHMSTHIYVCTNRRRCGCRCGRGVDVVVDIDIYSCTHIRVIIPPYIHSSIHPFMHAYMYARRHADMHACRHTYPYMHTHTWAWEKHTCRTLNSKTLVS